MFTISKKCIFYLLILMSSITMMHMVGFYLFPMQIPIQIPLSSFLAKGLIYLFCVLETYYLLPICAFICVLLFFSAISFLKGNAFLPIVSSVYLFIDLLCLGYSFFDAWLNDKHFIVIQAIQIIVSITIVVFIIIYFIYLFKQKRDRTGDGSLS